MKIAYIFHLSDTHECGVYKKIIGQSRQWIRYGAQVAFFVLTKKGGKEFFEKNDAGIPVFVHEYGGLAERFRKLSRLHQHALKYSANIIYYRYDLYHPSYERMAREIPVIVEVNSDDIAEFRLGSRFRSWYNRLTRNNILLYAKGLVFESQQLAGLPHFSHFDKPYLVMGNSIDLEQFRHFPAPSNPAPVIAFMGSARQPWHGVEKILWLAHHFKKWRFYLIGPDPEEFKDIPSNVRLHGFLQQSQYESLLALADVAIGPLSLYLIGKEESSPLKVREYLAGGIPTIIGYRDSDFPQGAPFLLQIENRPNNVTSSVAKIEEFVTAWQYKRVSREDISFLDAKVKEKKRFNFISHFNMSKE
ncbi:MAG TPA: glycosyltransferase [Thermodesulfovibrionales bacterium]|nr:glycosyltransferase [Thermodesulfovibrionales bacterium]